MKRDRGFTLIELLVVVAIIGILAAVGVTAYSGYIKSAELSASKAYYDKVTKAIKFDFFVGCEIENDFSAKKSSIFCSLKGEKLARTISSSKPEDFGLSENLENPNKESWIMYTPYASINSNVINAKNKPIGRLLIYDQPGNCFGFALTLGDDQEVKKEKFCY